jgi:hypothetical protein
MAGNSTMTKTYPLEGAQYCSVPGFDRGSLSGADFSGRRSHAVYRWIYHPTRDVFPEAKDVYAFIDESQTLPANELTSLQSVA